MMKESVNKNIRKLAVSNSKILTMVFAMCVVIALVLCMLCGAFANETNIQNSLGSSVGQSEITNPVDVPSTDTDSGTTGDGDATKGDITNPAADADKDGKISEKDGKLDNTAGATQTSTETANINTNPNDCKCLCFTAEDASCSVTLNKTDTMEPRDIKYSTDAGTTWNTWSFDSKLDFKNGEKIYVKGNNAEGLSIDFDKYIYFSISGKVASSGNIMSLIDDGKCESVTIPNDYCFNGLFLECTSLTSAPELPATTLSPYCYSGMFYGCTSLKTAPELKAKNLTLFCYQCMFSGCTSLTTAPELKSNNLADFCYEYMFSGCTSLTTTPQLPSTTLCAYCYSGMFAGCTSIKSAPVLNATNLVPLCYSYMFHGCTSLTTAPELPATTLAYGCYYNMFKYCTSIDKAPKLPATNLAEACYSCMFEECTSLKTAPQLPAKSLPQLCYLGMFYKCTSLEKPADISHVNVINKNCCTHMYWGCSGMQVYNNHREGYQKEWTTPNADEISEWSTDMFTGTSGDVSGNVTTKTTYFIKNGLDYVAEVVETGAKYETVQAAIDTVGASGNTVKMIADSTEDVTIGNDGKVTLDLSGHVLKGTGSNSVITCEGSSLTINDSVSADSSTHYFILHKQSKWEYIENPTSEQIAGSIDIDSVVSTTPDCAIVSVNGGVVTGGNKTTPTQYFGGGAICLYSGNSVINNGNFIGNVADKCYGGGVFVFENCCLTLINGKICGNQADFGSEEDGLGGGVYVCPHMGLNAGKFEMKGGSISNNCACIGGGIESDGETSLLGGQICNNTTKSGDAYGCGVVMTAGSDASNILGGDLVIKDNKDIGSANGDIVNNLLVLEDAPFAISSSTPLAAGASIGITTETPPALTEPFILSGQNNDDYSSYFSSDNARFEVINGENNTLQLEVKKGIDIKDATVSGVKKSYTYTGSKIEPNVTVTYDGSPLTKDEDYTVSYGNNTTVDEGGTVTIDGIGIFTGTKTIAFDITKASVEVPKAETNLEYNGQDQTGVKNQDPDKYNLTGNVAKLPGDYTALASLKDKDNYEWNVSNATSEDQSIAWSIAKAKVDLPQVKTDLVYNGTEQTGVEVPIGAKYDVSGVLSGVEAGKYSAVAKLQDKANYEWKVEPATSEDQDIEWIIAKRPITFTSDSASKVYDGTALTAEKVTVSGMGFAEGEDASYEFDASQKEIGSCANTFEVLWTEADESNYEPNLVYGTLEVTSPVQPTPSDDNQGSYHSNASSSSSTSDFNAFVIFGLLFVIVASSCTINIYRKKLNKNIK